MSKHDRHDWAKTGRWLIVCALIAWLLYLMAVSK